MKRLTALSCHQFVRNRLPRVRSRRSGDGVLVLADQSQRCGV